MQAKTAKNERPARAKRKLTRAERKQIEAVVRQAKGDGKAHTVQDSIPFRNIFPDGLCRLDGNSFSKTIAFADVNFQMCHFSRFHPQRLFETHGLNILLAHKITLLCPSLTHLDDELIGGGNADCRISPGVLAL